MAGSWYKAEESKGLINRTCIRAVTIIRSIIAGRAWTRLDIMFRRLCQRYNKQRGEDSHAWKPHHKCIGWAVAICTDAIVVAIGFHLVKGTCDHIEYRWASTKRKIPSIQSYGWCLDTWKRHTLLVQMIKGPKSGWTIVQDTHHWRELGTMPMKTLTFSQILASTGLNWGHQECHKDIP